MKGKIIHWFISMMALVILFKPSFSFAYMFEGRDFGIPSGIQDKSIQTKRLSVDYTRVSYNRVVYRWNIGEIMAGNYCRQRDGVTNPVSQYWLEIKYYDIQGKNSEYFEKSILEAGSLKIRDNTPYQFAVVNRGESLTFNLGLKLKDTFLYNTTPADISIPAGTPLAIITMLCVDKEASGNTEKDYQDKDNRKYKYNSFSMIKITSADSATFSFARTCTLEDNNQTIKLNDVTVKELNEKTEVLGGRFDIKLKCPTPSVKNAYIIFTDDLSKSNTGESIGRLYSPGTETRDTKTVLTVKDAVTNQPLVYRQALSKSGDFFDKPTGEGFYQFNQEPLNGNAIHSYNVYYRRVSDKVSVQPGKISAKLRYNIYYN